MGDVQIKQAVTRNQCMGVVYFFENVLRTDIFIIWTNKDTTLHMVFNANIKYLTYFIIIIISYFTHTSLATCCRITARRPNPTILIQVPLLDMTLKKKKIMNNCHCIKSLCQNTGNSQYCSIFKIEFFFRCYFAICKILTTVNAVISRYD